MIHDERRMTASECATSESPSRIATTRASTPPAFASPADEANDAIDDTAVDLLERLVRTPSISGNEARVARVLTQSMEELGFATSIDDVGNAIGTIGEGDTHVMLVGHMDTVPGDIPVRIDDGKLYGRGSVDAKGALAAFVTAAADVVRGGVARNLRITVVGCVEEEAPSSRGARHLVRRPAPDYLIVGEPSGSSAMTIGYKGYLRFDVDVAVDGHHSAHAAASASDRAVAFWNDLTTWAQNVNAGSGEAENDGGDDEDHGQVADRRPRRRAFDQVLPRLLAMRSENDGHTDRAALSASLRLPLDVTPAQTEAIIRRLAAGHGLGHPNVLGQVPAWRGGRTSPLHRALSRAILEAGTKPRYLEKTGTADANILAPAWSCPTVVFGPGDAALDHTPNEHIEIEEFLRGEAVLRRALRGLSSLLDEE